jgi:hypothetical protein
MRELICFILLTELLIFKESHTLLNKQVSQEPDLGLHMCTSYVMKPILIILYNVGGP